MKKPEVVCEYTDIKIEEKPEISEEIVISLAKCFLPDILAFFESEEGKKEFSIWKAERDKKKLTA